MNLLSSNAQSSLLIVKNIITRRNYLMLKEVCINWEVKCRHFRKIDVLESILKKS